MKYKEKYNVAMIDCVWDRCKNLQKINTIEIFFTVTNDGFFAVEYLFHRIDFDIWLQILAAHKERDEHAQLFDSNNSVILLPKNDCEYISYTLKSSKFDLYKNIQLIPYIYTDNWDNINESIMLNTISGEPLLK